MCGKTRISSVFIILLFSLACRSGQGPSSHDIQIVFASDISGSGSQLYAVAIDGTNAYRLTNTLGDLQARDVEGADCSPNGFYILFVAAGDLFRINSDGSNLTNILYEGLYGNPDWSPDSSNIAFNAILRSVGSNNNEIFIANSDGTNLIQLTNNSYTDLEPSWSPNGQKVVFAYHNSNESGIAIINVDGTNEVRLTQITGFESGPSWSPDGQLITFASNRDGLFNLYTVSPDGSNLQQLTQNSGNNINPEWSPDGSLISFSSDREGNGYQIFVMNSDGSNVHRVTPDVFTNTNNFNKCWIVSRHRPTQ